MNNITISDELLARYLASSASRKEIEQVETWLEASPDHIAELRAYRKLWERSRAAGRQTVAPDTDTAWKKVLAQMRAPTASREVVSPPIAPPKSVPTSVSTPNRFTYQYLAVAAVTLALLAWGWVQFSATSEPTLVSVSTQNNTYEKTLPDGTRFFLNYNSTLTYPEGLTGDIRAVKLQGEAFFDVTPDASHPFVIDANGTEIRVLGTSFNVKANQEVVEVAVKTGKVEVSKAERKVSLLPGEGVVVTDTVFRSMMATKNIAAYSTKVFDFTATSLEEVIQTLNQGFHANVRLAGTQLADCRLTAHYERESFDATLLLIAETMNVTIRQEGNVYWLEGKGCQ